MLSVSFLNALTPLTLYMTEQCYNDYEGLLDGIRHDIENQLRNRQFHYPS